MHNESGKLPQDGEVLQLADLVIGKVDSVILVLYVEENPEN